MRIVLPVKKHLRTSARFIPIMLAAALTVFTAPTSARQQVTVQRAPRALPNFDVRTDNSTAAATYRSRFDSPRSAAFTALESSRVAGMARLKGSFNELEVINSPELGTPEVVGIATGARFLTAPSIDRVSAMRAFLSLYRDAYGLSAEQATKLELVADYENPSGNMAWVEFEQKINGLPVFRGLIRGGFTARGELVRMTGALAAGLSGAALAVSPTLSGAEAISRAAANVGLSVAADALVQKAETNGIATFVRGPMAADARTWLMYFPLATGVARLAWAAEIWGKPEAFLVLLDAEDGTVLFRKNLTNYQSQPATYVVYTGDSPAPLSPSSVLPGSGTQASFVSRQSVTLIGNEAPNTFNSLGWMTDGTNSTEGNNVRAGIDRDGTDGVDATVTGVSRVFNFLYDPQNDGPLVTAYQNGEVTDTFFWTNLYHDRLYRLGFTEAARNFQNDNFGRGGIGGDRITAESQDSSGTGNATFSTSTDGSHSQMEMFLFTSPNPDRPSSLDHDVLLHELTHGTSNRLHSDAFGLTTDMSIGMGEGWSDFYARALLATADEDPHGIYPAAPWLTFLLAPGFADNYYYGIRRFPYASITTVGANGRPHNPLTFADIDSAQINTTDGAFPPNPAISNPPFEEHNVGEVWASALFEVRARFIARLGFAAGNERILQFVTDGMKLDPADPTFLQGRDSIIAAANAGGGTAADIIDIWTGFAVRGMGVSSRVVNSNSGTVIEAFDTPGIASAGASLVTESIPNGRLDPNETVTMSFCITNLTFAGSGAVAGTLIAGGGVQSPSTPQPFGSIPSGATVCRNFEFTVNLICGNILTATLQAQESGAATKNLTYSLQVGSPGAATFQEDFDSLVAPNLPPGWSTSSLFSPFAPNPWVTDNTNPESGPNRAFAANLAVETDSALVSPSITTTTGGQLTFRHLFNLEPFFDGGVLEVSIGTGAFQDILAAGGTFVTGGYSGAILNGRLNGRQAWTGDSGGYITTTVVLPPSAVGRIIRLRWRLGSDSNTSAQGWAVDTIAISAFECSGVPAPVLTSISPTSGAQGSSLNNVFFSGNNFISGGSTIAVDGPGVSIMSVSFISPTTLQVLFSIAPDATLGTRNLRVVTAGGTSNPAPFTVLMPPPTLTSISPAFGLRGTSTSVTITGTNFVSGSTISVNGTGVSVSNINVVSGTSITATFTIDASATVSARNVSVTTPGGASLNQTFNIFDPFPDLSISSSHTGSFGAGFNEVYSLLVTNVSTLTTTGTITVTDRLPSQIAFVSGSGPGFSCSGVNRDVTCTRSAALAAGASTAITLTVSVGDSTSANRTNTATVTTTGDLNPANNDSFDATSIVSAPAPTLTVTPGSLTAGQQAELGLTIPVFPHAVSGTLTLTFTPDAGNQNPADDLAIQFATGGRQVAFTIDANTTQARFAGGVAGPVGFQAGTVAGQIRFNGNLMSGTIPVTFSSVALTIPRQPPKIQSTQVSAQPDGFVATVTLLSTTRELTQLTLVFNTTPTVRTSCGSLAGCSAAGATITLDIKSLIDSWYASDITFGSLAALRLPFTITGATVRGTMSVTLRNSLGPSTAGTINIP